MTSKQTKSSSFEIETNNNSNTISTSNTTAEDSSSTSYMIYYLLGGIYVRPVGFIESGCISECLPVTQPYQLRRSSGELQIVPYQADDRAMLADYDYVMERNIAPGNVHYHEIAVKQGARLLLYGELFGGYRLEGPSTVCVNGRLCIAHQQQQTSSSSSSSSEVDKGVDLLAEEVLLSNVEVEVAAGAAALYVCDQKALVLLYNSSGAAGQEAGLFTIGLPEEELATESVARDIDMLKRVSKDTEATSVVRFQGKEVAAAAALPVESLKKTTPETTSKPASNRVASLKQYFTCKSGGGGKKSTLPDSELYRKKLRSLQQKSLQKFKSASLEGTGSKHTPSGYQNKQLPPLVFKSKGPPIKTLKTLKSTGQKSPPGKATASASKQLLPRGASEDEDLLLLQSSVVKLPEAACLPPTTVPAPFETASYQHHQQQQQPIVRAVSVRALQSGAPRGSGGGVAVLGPSALFPQHTGDAEVDEVLRQIAGNIGAGSHSQVSLATIPEEEYAKYSGGGSESLTSVVSSQAASAQPPQQQSQQNQQIQKQALAFLREQEHFYRALLKKHCNNHLLSKLPKPEEEEKEEEFNQEPSEEQLIARQQKLIAGQKALLAALNELPKAKEEPPRKLVSTPEEAAAEAAASRYGVQILLGTVASLMVATAAIFAFRE